jgi:hypothetical protein
MTNRELGISDTPVLIYFEGFIARVSLPQIEMDIIRENDGTLWQHCHHLAISRWKNDKDMQRCAQ